MKNFLYPSGPDSEPLHWGKKRDSYYRRSFSIL